MIDRVVLPTVRDNFVRMKIVRNKKRGVKLMKQIQIKHRGRRRCIDKLQF